MEKFAISNQELLDWVVELCTNSIEAVEYAKEKDIEAANTVLLGELAGRFATDEDALHRLLNWY